MAPKIDHPKTRSLEHSLMTEALLREMICKGHLAEGVAWLPMNDEFLARPNSDEVVAFCDLFQAGLRFPID